VIDFDVHHGNGTQDILCSTYDPRFLYVSLHAGGPEVNGVPMDEDDPKHELHDLGHNPNLMGIYPGRCGDTSPHKGVLNIPLGARVTAQDVGTALLGLVTPAVDTFAPDLIILSAGFDAHKNDPMKLGTLSAEDFGHITEVACQLASKSCSGRVLSILEGGYGVPCCRPQRELFLPSSEDETLPVKTTLESKSASQTVSSPPQQQSAEVDGSFESNTAPQSSVEKQTGDSTQPQGMRERPQPSKLLDLGEDLPLDMDDQVPYVLQRRLERCHEEGFVECVYEHVRSLIRCNALG
jgi:hypothetical protein